MKICSLGIILLFHLGPLATLTLYTFILISIVHMVSVHEYFVILFIIMVFIYFGIWVFFFLQEHSFFFWMLSSCFFNDVFFSSGFFELYVLHLLLDAIGFLGVTSSSTLLVSLNISPFMVDLALFWVPFLFIPHLRCGFSNTLGCFLIYSLPSWVIFLNLELLNWF